MQPVLDRRGVEILSGGGELVRESSREEGGPSRGTVAVDVVVHELDTLGVEGVEVRRDDVRVVEARCICQRERERQQAAGQSRQGVSQQR